MRIKKLFLILETKLLKCEFYKLLVAGKKKIKIF